MVADAPYTPPFQAPPDHPGRYFRGMARPWLGGHGSAMSKRILAGILWLFAAWYLGNIVSYHLGISDLLGPILGVCAALVVVADPLRILWTASDARPSQGGSPAVSD